MKKLIISEIISTIEEQQIYDEKELTESELRKEFYKKIVKERYEKILKYSLNRLNS